ncbi:MAG: inositol monophosphatase [Nitrospirae bacterium]|nr:inositol monophosphatase [Nitrospirota bacterium]MBF0553587.1 inositol monophosphatase [Nitrospirota bacterium]
MTKKVMESLSKYLEIAQDAVYGASRLLSDIDNGILREAVADTKKDIKVQADRIIELCIIDKLKKFSQFSILAEESGLIDGQISGEKYRWIVDPIDGSVNFHRGIPICCISVALWNGLKPLLGVVFDFIHMEMFSGIVGSGMWLNNLPVKVSSVSKTEQAILCTGFPVDTDFTIDSIVSFSRKIIGYKKVRLIGSAALSLAYVASARVDAYAEDNIKIWDIAAGIALVKAAGGVYTLNNTQKEHSFIIRAANTKETLCI